MQVGSWNDAVSIFHSSPMSLCFGMDPKPQKMCLEISFLKKKKISFLPRKSVFPFYKFGVYLVTAVSREAFSLDAAFFSSNLGFPQEAGVFLLVQCYTTENVNSCQSACFCSLLSLSRKLLGVLVGFIHGKFLLSS